MKTGLFTPRPGDLFTWHHDSDDGLCRRGEKIWSSSKNDWVSCVGINILISLTETDVWWIDKINLIHSRYGEIDINHLHPRTNKT